MKVLALILIPLAIALSGCTTAAVVGYGVANTHIETQLSGTGVCLNLPVVNKEVCLSVQQPNKSGDINFGVVGDAARAAKQSRQAQKR